MSHDPPPPLSPTPRRGAADFAALLETWDASSNPDLTLSPATDERGRPQDLDTAHRVAAAIRSAGTSPARSAASHRSRSRGARAGSPALSARSAYSTYSDRSSAAASRHARTQSEQEVETFLSAQGTPRRPTTPEIRTTSPSPQRPEASALSRGRRSPSAASVASARSAGSGGSRSSARGRADQEERSVPPPDTTAVRAIVPQSTGQSTSTIDQAYEGVFSALDLLGGASVPSAGIAGTSTATPQRSLPSLGTRVESILPERHLDALSEHTEPSSRQSSIRGSPNPALAGSSATAFQPSTPHRARTDNGSTRPTHRPNASVSTESIASLAGRFPLPASPVKGRVGAGTATGSGTPQATPKRASDLIKMFENRTGTEATPPPPQPSFATPAKSSSSIPATTGRPDPATGPIASGSAAMPFDVFGTNDNRAGEQLPAPALAPPPSAYRGPFRAYTDPDPLAPPPSAPSSSVRAGAATPPASIKSSKAGSPLSSFRSLVASWKSRSGSPSQRVIGSSGGKGGDSVLSRGGDRGWNVSIRRRRRRDDRNVVGLAERAEEPIPQPFRPDLQIIAAGNQQASQPSFNYTSDVAAEHGVPSLPEQGNSQLAPADSRPASIHSLVPPPPSEPPRTLSGEPIRTGTLWYLNVHDQSLAPNFEWVQADARLFNEGLHLAWRTRNGSYASAMLDMEFCEEVASSPSPMNPMAGGDIGAAAAARQEGLAEMLYPFKLVYDDGTERLGCDSARERVRWVDAIWTVLERTRGNPARVSSLRANRSSMQSTSDADGSASTHHLVRSPANTPQSILSPLPAGSPLPQYITDDAVITTSGGLAAPLAHRGSRRLAAAHAGRTRSLRRTASEADLRETLAEADEPDSSDGPSAGQRYTMYDAPDVPLTIDAARTRRSSRDFTFARGTVAAPALDPSSSLSPPPTYTAASSNIADAASYPDAAASGRGQPETDAQQGSSHGTAPGPSTPTPSGRLSPAASANTFGVRASAHDSVSGRSPATETEGQSSSSATYLTPQQRSVPSVVVSTVSPRSGAATSVYNLGTSASRASVYTLAPEAAAFEVMTTTQTVAQDPRGGTHLSTTATHTAAGTLGSPFVLADSRSVRESVGSFHTAQPPNTTARDSRYSTASSGSSVTASLETARRYTLYDAPVPSTPAASESASEYETVPPPPISRTQSSRSYDSNVQERSEFDAEDRSDAITHVSDPEADDEYISELERRSTVGSNGTRASRRTTMTTAAARANAEAATTAWATAYGSVSGGHGSAASLESMYATAPPWRSMSSAYVTAQAPTTYYTAQTHLSADGSGSAATSTGYFTAQTHLSSGSNPSDPPQSISTASSVGGGSKQTGRVPVPQYPPPPSPSFPSSLDGTSVPLSSSAASTFDMGHDFSYDVSRMLNWLQGQDEARAGQQSAFKSQLDRIEHKVGEIAERTGDLPPLSRSHRHGGDDGSPPSSPSSTASTARPITPPAKIVPDGLAQQLDDMRRLLGTVIGQNKDLMDEVNRRRSWDAKVPHLLRRALLKLGDDEFLDAHPPAQPPPRSAAGGSWYDGEGGAGSIYSDDLGSRVKGPPNSFTESHEALVQKRFSAVPDSLLDGEVPDGDFDEELAMRDLPPDDPPKEHILPKIQVPAHLLARRQQQQQQQQEGQTPQAFGADQYSDAYTEIGDDSPPPPPPKSASTTPPPIPYRDEGRDGSRSPSMYSEDEYARDGNRRGMPPPQPVDLPTPVRSPGAFPPGMGGQPNLGFRPGFPGSGRPGGMPMPRPPLPRIAGVRDPISSTYFRRGFPPGGPMPFGMFPGGPMGMPGPGMGMAPFMPGIRPFGGPIGPNVAPNLRRPGFFPPGVPGASGDYGLPAASRYGLGGPSGPSRPGMPPTYTPDTGIGNTTTDSTTTTPSATTEQLITPTSAAHHHPPPASTHATPAPPVIHVTDETDHATLGDVRDMTHAQGHQQNEISRYLQDMSGQIADGQKAHRKELATILADIDRLRQELKPKHVAAHVLPDGTVQLSNGDIVNGVRGAPTPGAPALPPPPPTVPHVQGKILPDGTVMVGDQVVDGVRGAPSAPVPASELPVPAQALKDFEQDRKLGALMDKGKCHLRESRADGAVSELMRRTDPSRSHPEALTEEALDRLSTVAEPTPFPREKTIIKEHDYVHDGPGGQHTEQHDFEEEISRPVGAPATRINPRTGKPLSLPKPLSLSPREPSLIREDQGPYGGQLIREEHEEIIQRPKNGGPPIHTHTTTRTFPRPDGTLVTETVPAGPGAPTNTYGNMAPAPASIIPPTELGNIPAGGTHTSDHMEVVDRPPGAVMTTTRDIHEEKTVAPAGMGPGYTSMENVPNTVGPGSMANVPGAGAPGGGGTAPPPGSMANIPGAPSAMGGPAPTVAAPTDAPGGKPAKAPKAPATVWETNHKKHLPPATTLGNMPTAPPGGDPKAPATGPPATSMANVPGGPGAADPMAGMGNMPAGGAGGMPPMDLMAMDPSGAGAPAPAGAAAPSAMGDPTGSTPGALKKKNSVRWDPHLPAKEVVGPPPRSTTPSDGAKAPAKGAAGPGVLAPSAMGNMPSDPTKGPAAPAAVWDTNHKKHIPPSDPAAAGPPMTTLGNMSTVGDPPMFVETDPSGTMHAVPAPPGAGAAGGDAAAGKKSDGKNALTRALSGGSSKKSKDETKVTGAGGGGPPVVPTGATPAAGGFMPLDHSGKDTRFSDTVGVGHAAGPHHDGGSGDVHGHHGTGGSAPTTPTNKLKKPKPDSHGHADGGADHGARPMPGTSSMETPAPGPVIPDGSRPAIITPSGEIIPTGPPIHTPVPSMGASLPSTTAGSAKGKKDKSGDAPAAVPDITSMATPSAAGGISLEGSRPAVITPAGEVIPTGPPMHTPAAHAPGGSGGGGGGGDGSNKLKKGKGGSGGGGGDGGAPPMPTADLGSFANMPPPSLLEEVFLPDGTPAYIRKMPQPSIAPGQDIDGSSKSGKKGKGGGGGSGGDGGGAPGGMPGVLGMPGDMGSIRGLPIPADTASKPSGPHCSVCCPENHKAVPGLPPTEPCAHHEGAPVAPSAGGKGKKGGAASMHTVGGPDGRPLPETSGSGMLGGPAAVAAMEVPGEGTAVAAAGGENKLKKGKPGAGGPGGGPPGPLGLPMTPAEQALEDVKKLATKQKAAAEMAAEETAERERIQQHKADKAKLAEDRHKENLAALADLKKALEQMANDHKAFHAATDDRNKAGDKRRGDKDARDKKYQAALDKLVNNLEAEQKKAAAEGKKPGTQAILDALKSQGESQAAFLRKLTTEVVEQLSNQHKDTRTEAKKAAREQVGFNLAGYIDDFAKGLSSEVRVLIKEVGDLKEQRRALYYELADLLLTKGRQSQGDMLGVLPYPVEGKNGKPAPPGNKPQDANKPKPPAFPAWSSFVPPAPPAAGLPPTRPLPMPGQQAPQQQPQQPLPPGQPNHQMSMIPGAVPPPPGLDMRPLPM